LKSSDPDKPDQPVRLSSVCNIRKLPSRVIWCHAYTLFNFSADYLNIPGIKDLNLQLNASNPFDKKYISTAGSAGLSLCEPTGTGQTLLPGAPRQVFITLSGKI
jgi:outer membrane receptor protein involved in Fe transport